MTNLKFTTNPEVEHVFSRYPASVRGKLENLRRIVLEAAEAADMVTAVEETLKWGEPSFVTKIGSTIRIDWKEKMPDQYAMYFQCTSKLVPTFRMAYNNLFEYEGSRALIFPMDESLPESELKSCITAALTYHKVKHKPMLGM